MLIKISQKAELYTGTTEGLIFTNKKDWYIAHLSKSYHFNRRGWFMKGNYKNEPEYLWARKENDLSVNWVDGPAKLYEWTGTNGFIYILDFMEEGLKNNKKVFCHCDRGESRSPTIGLLYLAKRTKEIKNSNYDLAKREFEKIYPQYKPGGIADYVSENWHLIY